MIHQLYGESFQIVLRLLEFVNVATMCFRIFTSSRYSHYTGKFPQHPSSSHNGTAEQELWSG